MHPGNIYLHDAFYLDESGKLAPKYLVVLSVPGNDDLVARLLTSRSHGRPQEPRCFHGLPYGGYFLGIPGGPLTQPTWVDLRALDDFDQAEFQRRISRGVLAHVFTLPHQVLIDVLECAAGSEDTSRRQERHLRDTLAGLR